jgi:hypothetical protein
LHVNSRTWSYGCLIVAQAKSTLAFRESAVYPWQNGPSKIHLPAGDTGVMYCPGACLAAFVISPPKF